MRLVWTGRAVADLVAIADYVNEHNPRAALALRDRISAAVERLAEFPLSGRPGRVAETRELVIPGTAFVVPYRVRGERIEIIAILHAAREWPPTL